MLYSYSVQAWDMLSHFSSLCPCDSRINLLEKRHPHITIYMNM